MNSFDLRPLDPSVTCSFEAKLQSFGPVGVELVSDISKVAMTTSIHSQRVLQYFQSYQ